MVDVTKRKALSWYNSDLGEVPDCAECLNYLLAPGVIEAAHSIAIEHPESAAVLARRLLNQYHADRHPDLFDEQALTQAQNGIDRAATSANAT